MDASIARVLVLDFGSQYTQLIARRIREHGVYSEIWPCTRSLSEIQAFQPDALILSGGPSSVLDEGAPTVEAALFDLGCPILAICYGLQLMCHVLGGRVHRAEAHEYGRASLHWRPGMHPIREFLPETSNVWMSHGDAVDALPPDFEVLAASDECPFAAVAHAEKPIVGLQFHPEVMHTEGGKTLLGNFLFKLAGLRAEWSMGRFVEEELERIRDTLGGDQVICGLSGGVDSSVVAALLHRAAPKQLVPVFVDHGLLRAGEAEQVAAVFRDGLGLPLRVVDASEQFLTALEGVDDPEEKRKIIGRVFIDVFEAAAHEAGPDAKWLAQGTLYPDVIESVSFRGPSATIKSHHNVGGLPERMKLGLIEPLRELFKDEVRELGRELGLPETVVGRHPFPGPGLAIRVLGALSPDRIRLARAADAILIEEIRGAGLYDQIWQAFAVLLPVRSVGVMGDARTYEYTCAIRCVNSVDGMTADWFEMPRAVLAKISNRIINEVRGINRVVYDVSSKPPATIEWE